LIFGSTQTVCTDPDGSAGGVESFTFARAAHRARRSTSIGTSSGRRFETTLGDAFDRAVSVIAYSMLAWTHPDTGPAGVRTTKAWGRARRAGSKRRW
jgi:hypothetical protein